MAGVGALIRNLVTDLKSSRRFQVATIIWIPLIVVSIVAFVRFSIVAGYAEKFQEFKTTFIPETTAQFPDMILMLRNIPSNIVCGQWSNGQLLSNTIAPTTCTGPTPNGFNLPPLCIFLKLSTYTAGWSSDAWGNPVQCNFTIPPQLGSPNAEMYLFSPGSWNYSDPWNPEPTFLRPNNQILVDLMQESFYSSGYAFSTWSVNYQYMTSIFSKTSAQGYTFSILFRIPLGVRQFSWQTDGFDGWFMIAMWGGAFYFFYFLFKIAFGIAKLFVLSDSKLIH